MKTAYIRLRHDPHYRLDAFAAGCDALGYRIETREPDGLNPDDLLIVWNLSARMRRAADRAYGAPVLVAENGYFGTDAAGAQRYALALDGHNGSGRWFVGDSRRVVDLKIKFEPLRPMQGRRILVAAQRGIGAPGMASPFNHAAEVARSLIQWGFEPTIREHPGRHAPKVSLEDQLDHHDAVVVWSSNTATEALRRGLPVFFCAPSIVTQPASQRFNPTNLSMPRQTEMHRFAAFRRLAWAQWSLEEIASGSAIRTLLDVHAGALPANQNAQWLLHP